MQNIEEKAIQTYQSNIEYLSIMHPTLHKDLINFDMAVEAGNYQQQYALEYINNNFDVTLLEEDDKYLYGKNSINISNSYAKYVNFAKDSSTIEIFSIIDIEDEDTIMDKQTLHARKKIYPMMTYFKKNEQKGDMKEIVKFIFSGVGLGLHIEKIDEKVQGHRYLIIEDDIELFKLSLFTTKYYEIAQRADIVFSVLEHINNFEKTYYNFINDAYMYNHLIKYTHLTSHSYVKLKHIISLTGSINFVTFPYQMKLDKVLSPYRYLYDNYNFLNIYKDIDSSILSNKPILAIASGPSLQKNISWLIENNNKFITIAVSSSLEYLYKNNITPDIVLSIDQEDIVKDFFIPFKDTDYLKNTILVFSALTHEDVIENVYTDNLYFTDSSMQFRSENVNFSYACVGSFAYLFSLQLQADDIYVLGLDLALNQETGEDHIDDHMFSMRVNMEDKSSLPTSINLVGSLIPIEGNFDETVYTTPAFHKSIIGITEHEVNVKKDNQNIYNLNHGAKVGTSTSLDIGSIDTLNMPNIDKNKIFGLLKNEFNKNSMTGLNDYENSIVTNSKATVKSIRKILTKYTKKAPSSNYTIYMDKLIKLSDDIYVSDKHPLGHISDVYKTYFNYAQSIIYSYFNTKNISNIKKHILEFDSMVLDGLYDITEQFERKIK